MIYMRAFSELLVKLHIYHFVIYMKLDYIPSNNTSVVNFT